MNLFNICIREECIAMKFIPTFKLAEWIGPPVEKYLIAVGLEYCSLKETNCLGPIFLFIDLGMQWGGQDG
jgi:hypothetical protein